MSVPPSSSGATKRTLIWLEVVAVKSAVGTEEGLSGTSAIRMLVKVLVTLPITLKAEIFIRK